MMLSLRLLALRSDHLKSPELCGKLDDALGRVAGQQQASKSGHDS